MLTGGEGGGGAVQFLLQQRHCYLVIWQVYRSNIVQEAVTVLETVGCTCVY